jgi:protein SCO1
MHASLVHIARLLTVFAVAASCMWPGVSAAQIAVMPKELEHVGVSEHLDAKLPLDIPLRDDADHAVTLGKYFTGQKPHVLVFAYHTCPVLCSMVLKATMKGLKAIPWKLGREFDLIVVSINPDETLDDTRRRKTIFLADYGMPGAETGVHFLLGSQASIDVLTKAAGVEYQYDAEQKQYGHPAVIMLVKPDGGMARYLYGLEFAPNDLRIGLLEASAGRSISTIEQLILYCYHYDPKGGKYVLVAWRVMRIGGGACGLALVSALVALWARERKRYRKSLENGKGNPPGPSGPSSSSPLEPISA